MPRNVKLRALSFTKAMEIERAIENITITRKSFKTLILKVVKCHAHSVVKHEVQI